jgi:hypothetical protein
VYLFTLVIHLRVNLLLSREASKCEISEIRIVLTHTHKHVLSITSNRRSTLDLSLYVI